MMACIISPNRCRWDGWSVLRGAAIGDLTGILNGLLQALNHTLEIGS